MSVLALAISTGIIHASSWTTDYQAALTRAKQEHKRVLLDFTGSDWCPYCEMLDSEVLSKDEFKQYADANFVLVMVDFPQQKPQSDDVKKANAALSDKFHVDGYPTLVVVASDGRELGRTSGYDPGSGPDAVISALKVIR